MTFILCTIKGQNRNVYFNLDHVMALSAYVNDGREEGSLVTVGGDDYRVEESIAELAQMISKVLS